MIFSHSRKKLSAAGLVAVAPLAAPLVAFDQRAVFLPLVPVMLMSLVVSPTARLLFFLLGGMFVLQSSQELDAPKLTYLAGAAMVVALAWTSRRALKSDLGQRMRTLLIVAGAATAFLLSTAALSWATGSTTVNWLRDVAPYLLLVSVPVVALDASTSSVARRLALPLLVSLGFVSAASLAVEWLTRRGLSDVPVDRLLLPTAMPAVALFFFALSRVLFTDRLAHRWVLVAVLLPLLLMLTGSRSLLVCLGPPLIVLMLNRQRSKATFRLIMAGLVAVALAAVVLSLAAESVDVARLGSRASQLVRFLENPNEDMSYLERRAQTLAVWDLFVSHPVFGTGPGLLIAWGTSWRTSETFSVDTALSTLSKFGILGSALLMYYSLQMFRSHISLPFQGQVERRFITMMFLYLLLVTPLLNPIEDKGTSFTLLVLALTCYSAGLERPVVTMNAKVPHARIGAYPIVQPGPIPR